MNTKYQWNLKKLYKTIDLWDKDLIKLNNLVKKFKLFNTNVNTTKDVLNALQLEYSIDKTLYSLLTYIFLKSELQPNNESLKYKKDELNNVYAEYSILVLDLEHSILKLSKTMQNRILKSKITKKYHPRLEQIINAKTKSSKKEERLLTFIDPITENLPTYYSNVLNKYVTFQDIKLDNDSSQKINHSNLKKYEQSNSRVVRKNAYVSKMKAFGKTRYEFARSVNDYIRYNSIRALSEKYESTIDYILKEDELKEKDVNTVLNTVLKNKDTVKKYIQIRKKALKIKDYATYDEKASNLNFRINLKDTMNQINDAFSFFENDANVIVKKLVKEKNINITTKTENYLPYVGYSYQLGVTDPWVFIWYQNELHSAMTTAHELGHAIHQHKLLESNDFWNADTSLIIHETVSFTHEMMYLLNLYYTSRHKTTKKKILHQVLKYYYDVIYLKSMNTKFEKFLYKLSQKNKPFKPEILNKKYAEIINEFQGDYLKENSLDKENWIGQERLFWNFYELKYVIAFAFADKIVHEILIDENKDTLDKFNQLMTMGNENKTKEFFKLFNLSYNKLGDLINDSFHRMNDYIEELESL